MRRLRNGGVGGDPVGIRVGCSEVDAAREPNR